MPDSIAVGIAFALDVIEGRLRDITDVMISVSEKVDSMDQTRP